MDTLATLAKIGLGKKEASIYLALLRLGTANIMDLSRETGISRPLVYKSLDALLKEGLASRIRKGKRDHYTAESPDRLRRLFETTGNDLDSVIPELHSVYQRDGVTKPVAKYFKGINGIRAIWDDLASTLGKGETYYRYSSSIDAQKHNNYLSGYYRDTRKKKQIERFVITNESISRMQQPDLNREVRIIPKESDLFEHGITELIYGHKVAFIDYRTETVFVIESEAIAEFQKAIFKTLYQRLPSPGDAPGDLL